MLGQRDRARHHEIFSSTLSELAKVALSGARLKRAQKDAGPMESLRLVVMAVGMAANRRRSCRIGSGLSNGESPPDAVPGDVQPLSCPVDRLMGPFDRHAMTGFRDWAGVRFGVKIEARIVSHAEGLGESI